MSIDLVRKEGAMAVKDCVKLYYEPNERIVTDEFGEVVFNIYDYITPNMFYLWRTNKQDTSFIGLSGETIELIYLEDEYHLY